MFWGCYSKFCKFLRQSIRCRKPYTTKCSINNKKSLSILLRLLLSNGAPGAIRTLDKRLRRPLLYPTELQARLMVGAAGFEPATPWSQARCSTKLSHAPSTTKYIIPINRVDVNLFVGKRYFSKGHAAFFAIRRQKRLEFARPVVPAR